MALQAIFFDTETTGTNVAKDRVVEIGAFNPTTGAVFDRLINPGIPIPPEASAISHITNQMVADAPSFAQVVLEFFEFCSGDTVLIGHNCDRFDIPILQNECQRTGVPFPRLCWLDSLEWARKYRKDLPRHALQYLRGIYGIPPNEAHRALNDVMILHQVFQAMIDDLSWDEVFSLSARTRGGPLQDERQAERQNERQAGPLYLFT